MTNQPESYLNLKDPRYAWVKNIYKLFKTTSAKIDEQKSDDLKSLQSLLEESEVLFNGFESSYYSNSFDMAAGSLVNTSKWFDKITDEIKVLSKYDFKRELKEFTSYSASAKNLATHLKEVAAILRD